MRPSEALALHRTRVRQIVLRHRGLGVRVFGSAARGEDEEGSDLDLLVETSDTTTLLDIGAIQQELQELLGIDVDVLTPNALPDRHRARILEEADGIRSAFVTTSVTSFRRSRPSRATRPE